MNTLPPDITALPPCGSGLRIGIFGGSFNPIHDGHRLVAEQCLRRLDLDAVWLLVSPGNPLKDHTELAPLETRVQAARAMTANPRIHVTGVEAAHQFSYSVDTLEWLVEACPDTRFVWIMGADNLAQFDRWERWQDIANLMPIAVYSRPGSTFHATVSKAAIALKKHRLPEDAAEHLADSEPPAWVYLHGITSPQSSSAIRARRKASAN
ncbi:MAG: nicotinate-nucleotide adenylyltransferase [Devosia sp.]|uniref:nicotinate-nucleotide adenylyltransferase n=1 Tax=Devosia sp. TaxID=1871048 RepID=UPI00261EBFF8|nr:nicotinate-nucleotide adenylyltransferase [Devosia sp.]MDB5539046.1 nicotinate-nucleotide adenylyltransferase [Devosia sp.]